MEKVSKVYRVDSMVNAGCEVCQSVEFFSAGVDARVNHYLEHGLTLLHVGQETSLGEDGKPWQTTVALLGAS